jgi:hypothetical protein
MAGFRQRPVGHLQVQRQSGPRRRPPATEDRRFPWRSPIHSMRDLEA